MTHEQCERIKWNKIDFVVTSEETFQRKTDEDFCYGVDAKNDCFVQMWGKKGLMNWWSPEDILEIGLGIKN